MMKNIIFDVATGERREEKMTAEEVAEIQGLEAERLAKAQAVADAKASAISKLEALGLTLDEVSAAFGLEA